MEELTQGIEHCEIYGPKNAKCFQYVKTNVPGPDCNLELFSEELEGCSCDKVCSQDSCPCLGIFGPTYNKGMLLEERFSSGQPTRSIIECGKNCKCDFNICSLRLVQKGIRFKLRVIKTVEKGYGLIAEEEIPRLAFVCEYAGEIVSENEAKKRLQFCENMKKMNYLIAVKEHSVLSQNQIYVDPGVIGNIGRFINHSCDPNLIMIPVRVNHIIPRLALFARKKISCGDELAFDYSGCALLDNVTPLENSDKKSTVSQGPEIALEIEPPSPDPKPNVDNNKSINDCPLSTLLSISRENETIGDNEDLFHSVKRNKIDSGLTSHYISHYAEESKREKFSPAKCSDQANDTFDKTLVQSHGNEAASRRYTGDIAVMNTSKDGLLVQASNFQRSVCLCKSTNCKGFLPYDSQLFLDL